LHMTLRGAVPYCTCFDGHVRCIWGGDRFRCELSKNTNITNVPLLRALTVA
jgi:hypothetical protein